MKLIQSYFKYSLLLPLFFIHFSCESTTQSTVHNGDVVGSWMMTALTGKYTYVIDLPASGSSGYDYSSNPTFGIRAKWEHEDNTMFQGGLAGLATFDIQKDTVGATALYTEAVYNLAAMQYAQFGLIGVFEDAPYAGFDATYKMKGTYPGIFYNYSLCASAGSTAPMTDQGLYTWNQSESTNNFVIKRDPDISGSQVLPTFDDGTLTLVDSTTLNIKFLDRDSHSTRIDEISDTWTEGTHPDTAYGGNGENSGGSRTYFAYPPLVVDSTGAFSGPYDGSTGTPVTSGYIKQAGLESWGGYMTWFAFCFNGELGYRTSPNSEKPLTDVNSDGAINAVDLIADMAGNQTGATHGTAMPYALLVSTAGAITDDSAGDVDLANLAAGGKMKFNVISDCAVPMDVTIDFDATFTRCANDNCVGDGYHVSPTWE